MDWRNVICWHCGQKGHTIKFCHVRRNDEDEGLISTNYDGDMYDKFGYYLDPKTPGGTRKEALRRAEAGAPPTPLAIFQIWQEKEVRYDITVEVGESEEMEQGRRLGAIKEEPIIVESDDEIEEDCWNELRHAKVGEDCWREARQTMERMEDLVAKVGRYQQKLADMCEEVKEWRGKESLVYLYDMGPGSQGGSGNLPGVTFSGPTPRSGMTYRSPSRSGRVLHAVRTRAKGAVSLEEPAKDVPEPSGEKEVVDVREEEEDEDDRLRKEEDEKAEQRVKKRGAKPDTDKSSEVKKNKYVVRVEEGFDVEEIMDRILEGHNHLLNLKDVLASAPTLRDELQVRKYQLHEDLLTIEDGAMQVSKHEKVIGGVYLLANALLQEEVVRNTVQDQEEGDNVIHEREDDDFEEAPSRIFSPNGQMADPISGRIFRGSLSSWIISLSGEAPATLWYGRHATFPIESFQKTWRRQNLETNLTFEELLDSRARHIGAIEDRIEEAASRTADSRTKDKFRWDKMARVRKKALKVGDIVLLYDSSLEKQWSRKLDKRWLGPYRVTRCGEHRAYQIEELNGTAWKDWVSGSRLKKLVARDEEQREEQSAKERELDRKERAAREQEIRVQLRMKNLAELHERMQQVKEPEEVDDKSGKGTRTQEEDLPLFSEVLVSFDKLMDAAGRSRGHHQEMGVRLVSADLLNLRGVVKEGFAAARASDEKVGERLTKVAQKAYGQRVEWEREVEDLKKGLERQGKEMEAVKADMVKGPAIRKERPPAEAIGVEVFPPTTQGETMGQQEGQESVGQTMVEAESKRDLKRCQASTVPQDMPLVAGLRDALGFWATGSEPEGRVGEQVMRADDRATCPTSPEVPQQEVTSKISTVPSSVPSQEEDNMT
ncbi:hypothetical protein CBR_g16151 [Chara braunii]|uniref:CCHC-type domain-containing protein n=1 Tax=Chara braunii TaxID=69332 RepID=A0A388KTP7_CHABU|nr:hypothetical protein CBR_g16151 [Chara braunii]|eukprot:GBG73435.1 hypothetical protein CBR_g16151 [Chara braunii]